MFFQLFHKIHLVIYLLIRKLSSIQEDILLGVFYETIEKTAGVINEQSCLCH